MLVTWRNYELVLRFEDLFNIPFALNKIKCHLQKLIAYSKAIKGSYASSNLKKQQ